jgi:G:T-mismatch repair DNA endonuclease (very short patch repair protein)
VFRRIKLVIFIDGDFWHGWRFPLWRHKLSPKWQEKIAATRRRDSCNFRKLRAMGWRVLRLWEHQVERAPERCIVRIFEAYTAGRKRLNRLAAGEELRCPTTAAGRLRTRSVASSRELVLG